MSVGLFDITHLSLQQVLSRLTLVPILVAGLVGLIRFRHLPRNLRYLTALVAFVLPLNVAGLVLMLQHKNNLFLMPIYTVGEFALLALVYGHTLQSTFYTRLLPWLVGGFAVYALLDSVYAQELTHFRPGQQVVQGILILALVGLYFRKLLSELRIQYLWRDPMFWVSAGLAVYYLGYLQIALFSNFLLRYSAQLNISIWAVHSLLFILLYSCYSVALWLNPPK